VCGICGIVTPEPRGAGTRELVARMSAAIVHRGPDEGSVDGFGRCVLGHQRLRVLDPEHGYQPVASESGDVSAVFNGELYNYRGLRAELEGSHELRGTGDTPVLPHLYEEDGPGFVRRLSGMFALALWDASRQRLLLARDRVGKKPLLWTRLPDGSLVFASELRALLRVPEVRRELDHEALDAYLALQYVPVGLTGLRGVHELPPAHVLVLEDGDVRTERYWTPEPAAGDAGDDGEWLERVRATVTAAVERRLAADVPLGALLSGGIDSSIVVALMAQASTEPVRTFTIGFAGEDRYDERPYARAVAERYGTAHEEIALDADVQEVLPRLAQALDRPLGDEAALPNYLVCEAARRHVTVALTGDGGDEAFAGYERYAAHGLAGRVPRPLALPAAAALRRLPGARLEPRSTAFRAARFLELAGLPAADRYGRLMEVFPPALRSQLWTREARPTIQPSGLLLGPVSGGVADLQAVDVRTYLPGDLLLKSDLTSMAHSLELRSPLLDHEVVELGLALPDRLKVRRREGKVALRRAFAAELPPEVSGRGKTDFGVPISRWFREDLRETARDVLLGEPAADRGLFDLGRVARLLRDHAGGRAEHGHRLWTLLMLELWLRTHVDATHPPETAAAAELPPTPS
jgi:asparagine synthase (glutamine-hydrolysing)